MPVFIQRPDFLIDHRSTTRHPVNIDTTISLQETQSGQTIVNLSLGGALITFGERLPIGTRLDLVFRLPATDTDIQVGGVVRWASEDSIGVQFDGLRAREVWSLNEYFKQFEG